MQNINRIELLASIFRAGAIIVGKFSGQGLDFAQFVVLHVLDVAGGKLPKNQLSKTLGLNSFGSDRTINSLIKIKAVRKEGSTIAMTESGRQMYSGAVRLMEMRTSGLIPEDSEGETGKVTAFLNGLEE